MINPPAPDRPNRGDRFRFQLRDLFVFTAIAAILCAWWIDRSRLSRKMELLELRLARKHSEGSEAVQGFQKPDPAVTPAELVTLVASDDDWYELQDVLRSFRASPNRGDAIGGLLELAVHHDEIVRTRALTSLAQIKEQGDMVVPVMIPLLDDPVPNVQWHAANVLGEFGTSSPEALAALDRKMKNDNCGIATYAASVLKKLDPSVDIGPRLTELIKSPIRENRWRAVTHLRHHIDADTAQRLLTAAFEKEKDEEIRKLIADALNGLES